MQEHATTRIKRTKCFTTVTKIILNLPDNIETCNWGGCDNALFKQGNPLSDLGMLPGYAEAQRDYGYRLPGSDNDDAVIPVAQSERGAIDDEVELAKSQFLRSEKAGYQTGAFDGRDISRAGDTMTALFKKNYGYTPSAGELIQYADLARSSNPREFTENVQDRGRYSPLRLRPNQIYNQDRISGARGLLSEFSENGNRIDTSPLKVLSEARNSHRNNDYRDEAAFEDLINGYSGAEDSSWYSKSDQSEMSQNDMRREIDLLNRRTNTLASESKSGIISTNGKDYYLMTRDPNGLGIYQQRDLGDSASRDARFDQGGEADDIQKVTVTGRRMSNMEKENYDREQMQLSMQKYRSREQAHSGNKSSPFLKVPTGQITFNAEGNDVQNSIFFTRKLHHPSYESGVTIGRGYDMKNRSQEQVRSDLISAGMSQEQAEKYAKGAGLKGEKAEQFVIEQHWKPCHSKCRIAYFQIILIQHM